MPVVTVTLSPCRFMAEITADHLVVFQPSGRQGRVAEGTSLLEAARHLGVDVDSICGGRQTCGKCKIRVETGSFPKYAIESDGDHLTLPDETERDYFERHPTVANGATRVRGLHHGRRAGDRAARKPGAPADHPQERNRADDGDRPAAAPSVRGSRAAPPR